MECWSRSRVKLQTSNHGRENVAWHAVEERRQLSSVILDRGVDIWVSGVGGHLIEWV
jgi:hypothetical protein